MCLIFYSFNHKRAAYHLSTVVSFSQSISDEGLYGGMGVAWLRRESRKWGCLRRLKLYNNLDSFPDEIVDNDLVIGHVRKLHQNSADIAIENVHPFFYNNQIFLHNGYIDDFRPTLVGIDKGFKPFIKGETDTEYMFYLFLTIKNKLDAREIYATEEDILVGAVEILFQYLCARRKPFRANIVYANSSYSIITRYAYLKQARLLYFNGEMKRDKLLISSLPVMDNHTLIPPHTLIIVDHVKNTYKIKKLK